MPGPGGILALDLARITGWCYGLPWDDPPAFGTWHMPLQGGEGAKFAAFENELIEAVEAFQPARILAESPLPLAAMNNRASAWQQLGMRAFVRSTAYRHSIPTGEISADMVRMELLGLSRVPGNPDGIKQHVVLWCRRKGWRVPDHNAGDACLLWEWAASRARGTNRVQHALPITGGFHGMGTPAG